MAHGVRLKDESTGLVISFLRNDNTEERIYTLPNVSGNVVVDDGAIKLNSWAGADTYPLALKTTSGRGIKIGEHTDDGADHGSALNIGNSVTTDINLSTISRDIHVQTYYSVKQSWNVWNQILCVGFDGTATYSQNTGPGGVYNGTGNLALQLRGSNANLTIPSHIYFNIQNPTGSGGVGAFAGTITSLYGIYIETLNKGTTNYSIYTNGGPVNFGDDIYMHASGVAHGMTTTWPTDVFFDVKLNNTSNGGAAIYGLTDADLSIPLILQGVAGVTSFTGAGTISFRASKKSGTSTTSLATTEKAFNWQNSATVIATMMASGSIFLGGSTTPTAVLHLAAGTAAAGTAPLKLTSGTNLTTAEAGAFEYNGTNLFFTRTGTTRESVICSNAVNSVSPTAPDRTITVVIAGATYYIHAKTTND